MKKQLYSLFFCVLTFCTHYANAQINNVTPLSGGSTSPTYSLIEFGITLNQVINSQVTSGQLNPYNPDEINLWAELVDANTMQVEKTIYGFYMEEFNTNATGQATVPTIPQVHNWRLRLVVEEPKQYLLNIYLSVNQASPWAFQTIPIAGQASNSHGYLRFPKGHNYLEFTDGTPFFAVGETLTPFDNEASDQYWQGGFNNNTSTGLAYPSNTVEMLNEIVDDFATWGGNYIKYNFAPNSIDIEWPKLGNYSDYQNRAHDFDNIISNMEDNNLYLQLGIWTHEQFNEYYDVIGNNWDSNPYSTIQSPSVSDAIELFVDNNCNLNYATLAYMQRKIRYCIARWGYSTSLASIELFNELENFTGGPNKYSYWTGNNLCTKSTQEIIDDGFIYLADYTKSIAPRILVTCGMAGYVSATKFNSSNSVDYIDFHDYNSSYMNGGSREAYISEFVKNKYKKPFHSGECGRGFDENWYISTFDNNGLLLDNATYFSNILWSSSFSGAFSNAMLFGVYGYTQGHWGQSEAYQKARPLSEFFNGENLNSQEYKSIKNKCIGGFVLDCNGNPWDQRPECVVEPSYFPTISIYPRDKDYDQNKDQINALAPGSVAAIYTTNDDFIEVYALQSATKTMGWVHNKENYFYNLPHLTAGHPDLPAFIHPDANGNPPQPVNGVQNDRYVNTFIDESMTITGFNCSGIYQIDWYSTRGNGGIIPALTVNNIQPVNGSITVTIPDLEPITAANQINLPDYGFKITMTQNNGYSTAPDWKSDFVNEFATKDVYPHTPITVTNNNRIYYRGNDGKLHCNYFDEHCWEESEVPVWASNDEPSVHTGMVATPDNKIFYRNNVGRLEQIYEIASTGNKPNWVSTMHSSAPEVASDCNTMVYNDALYYVSNNHYITEVYWDGSAWAHREINWPAAVSVNTSGQLWPSSFGFMPGSNRKIFYRNVNGKIEEIYWTLYQGTYQWVTKTHTTAHDVKVNSDIKTTPDGRVVYQSTNGYITVLSFNQSTQQWSSQELSWIPPVDPNGGFIKITSSNKIFYKNIYGNLQQIYWELYQGSYQWIGFTHWMTGIRNTSPIVEQSSGKLFYYDNNDDINEVYFDNATNSWLLAVHQNLDPNVSALLVVDQYDKIYFVDTANPQMKVLWWDDPCTTNTPCTYSNYKPSKPNIVHSETVHDSQLQVQGNMPIHEKSNDNSKDMEIFTIFPNPSSTGEFNITNNESGIIQITDIHGKVLLEKEIVSTRDVINLSSYANGIYILSYRTANNVRYERLTLKK